MNIQVIMKTHTTYTHTQVRTTADVTMAAVTQCSEYKRMLWSVIICPS